MEYRYITKEIIKGKRYSYDLTVDEYSKFIKIFKEYIDNINDLDEIYLESFLNIHKIKEIFNNRFELEIEDFFTDESDCDMVIYYNFGIIVHGNGWEGTLCVNIEYDDIDELKSYLSTKEGFEEWK